MFPLFLDVLILAVDTNPAPPQANAQGGSGQPNGGGGSSAAGFQQMNMMSFAVTPEDSLLLSQASRGVPLARSSRRLYRRIPTNQRSTFGASLYSFW